MKYMVTKATPLNIIFRAGKKTVYVVLLQPQELRTDSVFNFIERVWGFDWKKQEYGYVLQRNTINLEICDPGPKLKKGMCSKKL